MAIHQKPKERISERKHPGDKEPEWCSPGSIEQQLDMCEGGSLRGDNILYNHGLSEYENSNEPQSLDQLIDQHWNIDLSEENREGDEMSGDDHSSGLQGGELELDRQLHLSTGLPGDQTRHEEEELRSNELSADLRIPVNKMPPQKKMKN